MIRKATNTDYPRLIAIWDSSVSHTHSFLAKEDFLFYKERLPIYFENVSLYGFEQEGNLVGFIGVHEDDIEMLFIHNDWRGKGIGKQLILHAVEHMRAAKVSVNEQNTMAVGFYRHLGFSIVERSSVDPDGKPYPILHMRRT